MQMLLAAFVVAFLRRVAVLRFARLLLSSQVVFVLLQTLILFMLHCSGVNNFISNCTTAVSAAVAAPESRFSCLWHTIRARSSRNFPWSLSALSPWHRHTQEQWPEWSKVRGWEGMAFCLMKLTLTQSSLCGLLPKMTAHKCEISHVTDDFQQIVYSSSKRDNATLGEIIYYWERGWSWFVLRWTLRIICKKIIK